MKETQTTSPLSASGLVQQARQPNWEVAGVCALLVIVVFLVFGQTVRHGFIDYDDGVYVYGNPSVLKVLSIGGVGWVFTHVVCNFYHPLTMLSLILDHQIYGLHPGGYHLTNILLHAASAVVLFLVLRQMTGFLCRSAFVAAVFAIHPLRVESVAWVAERKDVLCGLLFMVTLGAYVRCARRPFSAGNYLLLVTSFGMGLLSKPAIVTLPFLLILLDYWPLGRFANCSARSLIVEKLPLLLLSAVASIAAFFAQGEGVMPTTRYSMPVRLENAVASYATYLLQMIYPARLAPFYPHPEHSLPASQIILSLTTLGTISTLALFSWRRRPYVTVGWFWYVGMLVPMIGFVQVGSFAHADRFTYLPQIGLYVALTWAVSDWAVGWRHRRAALGGAAVVVLCVLMLAAYRQTSYWRDSISLWTHTIRCTKDNFMAHDGIGKAMFQQGRTEEATAHLREAVRINPAFAEARNNLGNALKQQARTEEAIAQYQEALRINPAFAKAHYNLGLVMAQQGRMEEAVAQYRDAVRVDPAYAEAYYNLGSALQQQGRTEEAVAQYREALRINPAYPEAHNNLGNALQQQGHVEEAIGQYHEALQANPAFALACYNLGNALQQRGRTEEAIAQYQEALRINPDYADAHSNLGSALQQQGRTEEAIAQYHEALRINPALAEACYNLGSALQQQGRTEEAIGQMQKALALQPANGVIQTSLAWTLATAAQMSLRNGARAVELATQASQSGGGNSPDILRTLAAAYAAAGDFQNALQTARKALQLAEAQANTDLASKLRREITLYEARQPYREGQ